MVAHDFTSCLAHIEVTEYPSTGAVVKIAGYLEHNDACKASLMTRYPRIPLHNDVLEVALKQLDEGAR